jgi:hypothetical protein
MKKKKVIAQKDKQMLTRFLLIRLNTLKHKPIKTVGSITKILSFISIRRGRETDLANKPGIINAKAPEKIPRIAKTMHPFMETLLGFPI